MTDGRDLEESEPTSERRGAEIILTLVIHANAAGVEADVVLVFVSLVLHDVEERRVFHLQPEFAVFVFQRRFILFLGDVTKQSASRISHAGWGERRGASRSAYRGVGLQGHQPVIDRHNDRKQALRGLALGFGFLLLPGAVAELSGGGVVVHHFLLRPAAVI